MEELIIQKIRDEETRNYGFNLLVREYQERVYWHVRKMVIDHDDADDLVQEIFVKVWKKPRFIPRRFKALHLDLPHCNKRMPYFP